MRRTFIFGVFFLMLMPFSASAAAPVFEVFGWIPYWRASAGSTDALSHLENFSSLMPFGYIVQDDGSLHDAFGFDDPSATSTAALLLATAHARGVRIVPTVMWSNTSAIHTILSSTSRRIALEDAIAKLVKDNKFDGIDIDFENKLAKTRPYFSLFLKGLYARMGKKWVYCSIEARTPTSSAFVVTPKNIEYANDYVAINKYCDRVHIMAYDQGAIDLKLNAAADGTPYVPVADPQWVKKVIAVAAQTISKKKIIIGIPTYGYEYDLIPLSQGYRYARHWALNPGYATDLAKQLGITPTRNHAGEMSFTYAPTTTPQTASALPDPRRVVWWSDAGAIQDKIDLARTLGVRGVALFKIDGGEDPALWNILPKR
ncbi:MAG: glycosyl hydrolase family 18 protein [Candidatus Pacebacteria bacterium]|nr:glycosyl hydrolase family 18 protein [Candidatus Paceibacterota bacterium]